MAKRGAKSKSRIAHLTPIQRLARRGELNVYEQTAADEILHAYHVSIGVARSRDHSLGLPSTGLRAGAAEKEAAYRLDLVRTYARWKDELRGRPEFDAAVAVLIEERSLRDLTGKNAAKERLIAGLRHWAAMRGNTPRGCGREWKIA